MKDRMSARFWVAIGQELFRWFGEGKATASHGIAVFPAQLTSRSTPKRVVRPARTTLPPLEMIGSLALRGPSRQALVQEEQRVRTARRRPQIRPPPRIGRQPGEHRLAQSKPKARLGGGRSFLMIIQPPERIANEYQASIAQPCTQSSASKFLVTVLSALALSSGHRQFLAKLLR